MKKVFVILWAVVAIGWAGCSFAPQVEVTDLRLEMQENPLGVSVQHPRFSWKIVSVKADLLQKAYRIQVAGSPEQLEAEKELLWDSGKEFSDRSVLIPYAGEPLESGKLYFWRVKLTTNQGDSDWSQIASWSMALPEDFQWKAVWIGENMLSNPGEEKGGDSKKAATRLAARYLRKDFSAEKPVKRAVLYISGLGSYEAYLNGKKVSEDVFAPMPTLYDKRVYYNVYEVTGLLNEKDNTLGVILGNGRFFSMRNPGMKTFGLPRLLALLRIEHTDGTVSEIGSDTSWKITSQGPIVANNEFDGEEYDARLEKKGWNEIGYDDQGWKTAEKMEAPAGKLTAQPNPNIRIQETLTPVAVYERPGGKYLLDMGQNMVGWLAVDLNGKKDRLITMKFAEILRKDSSLYLENLRTAKVTDIYIPAQDGAFSWQPRFVYHGFRYVEISGLDYKPEPSAFAGHVIYDRMATTGHFETSNELITRIHKNAYWGIRGNYRGMPTDCPQRDERLGWLGDRATGVYGEAFIFDNSRLYAKWLQDIEDSMSPEGQISDVSPRYWTIHSGDVTWPSAFFYAADMLFRQYGDDQPVRTHYPAMKRWMKMQEDNYMKDYILTRDTYGDWCMPPESEELIHSLDPSRKTDGAILSTTVYFDLLHKMISFARICGQEADIPEFQSLAAKIKEAYNARFFDEKTAQYGNNTVTANILSLRLGLVPEGYEQKVFENIVHKTEHDFNGHISTGVLGVQHLMRGLTEYGRADLAYKITTNETYPSWGYMVRHDATTIWELWNGNTADPAMNSGNHVMLLGDLLIWYYEDLAGIKCAPGTVGFKKLLMAPVFPEGLDSLSASYCSVYGRIESSWDKKDGKFSWNVTLPGNTSATVRIPKAFQITVKKQAGIRNITETDQYVDIEIGSGSYHFGNKK